jgi:pantetheine-phosphate adenylyltransferase
LPQGIRKELDMKVVYPGSFDPITLGHINVVERVAHLCDELVVVVAVDPEKKYTFSLEERREMAIAGVKHMPNVTVAICEDEFVATFADKLGATAIYRGIRNTADLEKEDARAQYNKDLCPNIETVFIMCHPLLKKISSSSIKNLIGPRGWEEAVSRYVGPSVLRELIRIRKEFKKPL